MTLHRLPPLHVFSRTPYTVFLLVYKESKGNFWYFSAHFRPREPGEEDLSMWTIEN